MFRAVGAVSKKELITTYRRLGARLEGHPTPALPWVDVATGSLGRGLPDAVGVCLAGEYLDKLPCHAWVLCGDSETAEGSIWESLDRASAYHLGNLTVIVDVNRLGQRGPTELGWDLDRYAARIEAFGCRPLIIDGHDLLAIDEALTQARSDPDQPTVVLARTIKAKDVPEIEDKNGWHGKSLPPDMAERAIAALGGPSDVQITTIRPEPGTPALTRDPNVKVTLRAVRGARCAVHGARCTVHGSVVLYPADATCTAYLVDEMADTDGIVYLRTTRGAYPVLYPAGETFPIGGSKLHGAGPDDQVALIGAGVTLHECLAAAEELAAGGIRARVLDLYWIKPIDRAALADAARATGGRLVVAEDHYPQGGIGEAVLAALADPPAVAQTPVPALRMAHLAVSGLPTSGTPAELLDAAGISARHIADAARRLVGAGTEPDEESG